MNRIVREHYPVEKLPEDLRAELGVAVSVKLTIEAETSSDDNSLRHDGHFSRYRHLARPHFSSVDEVNAHIAALRDE